ncbi:MAG: nucleotidyl transferase AbiEii/AbiGii toxin family protein [Myxococcota bacterium]
MDDPKVPVVRALATRPDLWVFRGSLVTAAHIAPWPREADDVDLIALPHLTHATGLDALEALFGTREHEVIWAETDSPGLRLQIGTVQVDLAFGDPIVPDPIPLEVLGMPVSAVRIESMIAWKLHGLFENESRAWRPKDLADLHDLLVRPPRLDSAALDRALETAFVSRDAPFRLTDRLRTREMGRTRGSRKTWTRYLRNHPERRAQDLPDVLDTVAAHLEPHLEPLRRTEPDPTPFAVDLTLAEVEALTRDHPGFACFEHGPLRVFATTRNTAVEDPSRAITHREHRRRQVLRECRGLTFHADGRLLSRKLHRFAGFSEKDVPPGAPRAVEKLDGSMVSPLVLDGTVRLVTRRGPSELGDRATPLLTDRARRVFRDLLARDQTPVLEWTSRSHRIVLAHPEDRLTLLAVRDHATGAYGDWDALAEIAADAGLPVPRTLGRIADPVAFAAEVRAQTDGEGWVLQWDDGTWMKLKSDRYRRLHRVVEGPDAERALWAAVLHGEGALAEEALAARGIPVAPAVHALEDGLAELAERVRADVAGRTDDPAARAELARRTAELPAAERRLRFRAWDGDDPDALVREVVRDLVRIDFAQARALLGR